MEDKMNPSGMLFILFILVLISLLLSACSAQQSPEESSQKTEEQKAAELELVNHAIAGCRGMQEDDQSLCLAKKAVEYDAQAKGSPTSLCPNADNPDMCFYYSAFMLRDASYCDNIQDAIGCRLASQMNYCMNYENKNDECIESQLEMIKIFNVSLAEETCNVMSMTSTRIKKMCKVYDWTDLFPNSSEDERFVAMFRYSKLSGFSEETVISER